MHWTQRGREGGIFFLRNGSGSAISLSFKKTSKEVGMGNIFKNTQCLLKATGHTF